MLSIAQNDSFYLIDVLGLVIGLLCKKYLGGFAIVFRLIYKLD